VTDSIPPHIVWQRHEITRADREHILGQQGRVVWLTGLSGSGKSTIASRLESELNGQGRLTYLLDGDNLRHGLCADLGFSAEDRRENGRRASEVARLMVDAGIIVIVAMITPLREDRRAMRARFRREDFLHVWVSTPLEVCEARDVKGLYARARSGEIRDFTGISAPYEPPLHADLDLNTAEESLEACVARVVQALGYTFP
jgi:adenylylsulfate kinase